MAIILFLSAVGFRLQDWLHGAWEGKGVVAFALYLILGLMLYGLAKLQKQFNLTRPYAKAYELLGLLITFGSMYLLGFRLLFDSYTYRNRGLDVDVSTGFWVLFYLAVGVVAASLLITAYAQLRRRLPLMTLPYEGAATLLILASAILVVSLEAGGGVFYPLLFNGLLFLGVTGLVFAGYFLGREELINIALIFFSIGIISRYFELGWDLYDRSLVFIVAGIILLGGGFLLERGRRKVFDRMATLGARHES